MIFNAILRSFKFSILKILVLNLFSRKIIEINYVALLQELNKPQSFLFRCRVQIRSTHRGPCNLPSRRKLPLRASTATVSRWPTWRTPTMWTSTPSSENCALWRRNTRGRSATCSTTSGSQVNTDQLKIKVEGIFVVSRGTKMEFDIAIFVYDFEKV